MSRATDADIENTVCFGTLITDGEVCRCSHLDYVEGRPGVICAVCDRTASTASPWEPSWERATTTAVEQWRSPPVEADHMVAHLGMDLQVSATAKKGDEAWVECPHGSVRVRGHSAAPEGFYMRDGTDMPRCTRPDCVRRNLKWYNVEMREVLES